MKNVLTKVTILIITNLVIILFAFEIFFRFLYDTTDILNFGLSSQRWNQRHVQLNSLGFRDDEPTIQSQWSKESPSIFFIGDSFTFGLGIKQVKNRYSNLVCDAIRKKIPNVRCFNLAYHGWDLNHEVYTFEKFAQILGAPDVVLFQYFMNDIEIYERVKDINAIYSVENYNSLMNFVHSAPQTPLLNYLYHKSYAFNFFYLRYRLSSSNNNLTYEDLLQSDYADPQKYRLLEVEFKKIVDLRLEHSSQVGFVIFPLMNADRSAYKLRNAHEQLKTTLSSNNLLWVDLTDVFWSYPARKVIVNSFDSHPNEFANMLAARKVLPIVANLLEKNASLSSNSSLIQCHLFEIE